MKDIKKILFLLDGSDYAIESAEFTLSLARSLEASVIAINIIDPVIVQQMVRFQDKSQGEVEIELEENGWKYLYYFEEMALEKKVKSFIQLEIGNIPDRVILFSKKYKTDLIVIPQHSEDKSGTKSLGYMKNVEQIIEHAPCSVLISHPK